MEGINRELQEIEKEVNSQSYTIAQRKLNKLQERKDLTREIQAKIQILLSKNVFHAAENQKERLHLAEEAVKECRELDDNELLIEALTELARCKFHIMKYDESLENIEEIKNLLKDTKTQVKNYYKKMKVILDDLTALNYNRMADKLGVSYKNKALEISKNNLKQAEDLALPYLILEVRYTIMRIMNDLGDFNTFEEWVNDSAKIAQKANEEIWEVRFTSYLARVINGLFGRHSEAIEIMQKSFKIFDKYEINYSQLRIIEAMAYFNQGNLEKAIEFHKDNPLTLIEEDGFGHYIINKNIRFFEGLHYWWLGDFEKAISTMKEIMEEAKKVNDKTSLGEKDALTGIYIDQGKLDLALEIIAEQYKSVSAIAHLFPEFALRIGKARAFRLFSKIYYLQGKYELALEHAEYCVDVYLNIGEDYNLVENLLLTIKILYERNELDIKNNYLKKLEKVADKSENPYFKQSSQVGSALALKTSYDPKDWAKAIKLLEEVMKDKIVNHTLTADAMIILCELLITEFSYTGNQDILQRLEKYTDELENIAYKQNAFHIKLEASHIHLLTLWLKAQYSLAEIDLEKANELLLKTRNMADEEGLMKLAEKITLHHGEMIARIDQWAQMVKNYTDFLKE
jgi:hypothetical protein